MKWFFILFSIFKPFFSAGGAHEMPSPIEDLKDLVKKNAVKVMIAFGFMSAMASIFAAGLILVAVNISAQYDQNAVVAFSSMILSGIILMLIPIIAGIVMVKMYDNNDDEVEVRKTSQKIGNVHPLQDALALLVHDFVKEREMKRAHEEATFHEFSQSERRHTTRNSTDSKVPTEDDFRH